MVTIEKKEFSCYPVGSPDSSPLNNNSWFVAVKFRGKNAFGAYVLNEMRFEIRNGKIVKSYSVNH